MSNQPYSEAEARVHGRSDRGGACAGNAQPYKLDAVNAMGDRELAGFIGRDIMERAYDPCLSILGPMHFAMPRAMGRMEPLGMPGSNRGKGSY